MTGIEPRASQAEQIGKARKPPFSDLRDRAGGMLGQLETGHSHPTSTQLTGLSHRGVVWRFRLVSRLVLIRTGCANHDSPTPSMEAAPAIAARTSFDHLVGEREQR